MNDVESLIDEESQNMAFAPKLMKILGWFFIVLGIPFTFFFGFGLVLIAMARQLSGLRSASRGNSRSGRPWRKPRSRSRNREWSERDCLKGVHTPPTGRIA